MSIGRYVTSLPVIGAVLGVFGVAKQTQRMPRDWRRIVVWVVWLAGVVLAVGSVAKREEDEVFDKQRRKQR